MTSRTVKYDGEDYVIPCADIEALGIRPGDQFTLTLHAGTDTAAGSEREEIESVLKEIARAAPDAAKDAENELRKLLDKFRPGD